MAEVYPIMQQQQQHQLQNPVVCSPSRYLFKKFKCSNCDYRAISRWYIKRHIGRMHKDKLLTTEVVEVVNQESAPLPAPSLPAQIPPPSPSPPPPLPLPAAPLSTSQQPPPQVQLPEPTQPPQVQLTEPTILPTLSATSSINNAAAINDNVEEIVANDEDSLIPPQPDRNVNETEKQPRPWSYDPSTISSQKRFIGSSITSNDGLKRKRFNTIKGPINLQLKEHFKIFIQGPSGSGKSMWVYNLLEHLPRIAQYIPEQVLYIYARQQPWMDEMLEKKLVHHFIEGNDIIDTVLEEHFQNKTSSLVIFDDQMNSQATTAYVAKLFTVDGRHSNLSLIWMSQAVFGDRGTNGRQVRLIRSNADYLVIFKAPGDINSIRQLSTQMCTDGLIRKIYDYITSEQAHSYLMINITQTRTIHCTYLTNIFRENGPYIRVFVPTPKKK